MKLIYKSAAVVLIALISSLQLAVYAQGKKPVPKLGKSTLKQVIDAMTLQEKSKLVVGMGFKMPGVHPPISMAFGFSPLTGGGTPGILKPMPTTSFDFSCRVMASITCFKAFLPNCG